MQLGKCFRGKQRATLGERERVKCFVLPWTWDGGGVEVGGGNKKTLGLGVGKEKSKTTSFDNSVIMPNS